MVDWSKDVKLSDLVGRKKKEAEETFVPAPEVPSADEVQPAADISPAPAPTPAAQVAVSPAPPALPAPAQAIPAFLVPEPETQLEPELEAPATESVPWYKRELSFGGSKGDKPPKKTKQPKARKTKQPKAKKEKRPKEKQAKGERVPFYKRELSFGGKKG